VETGLRLGRRVVDQHIHCLLAPFDPAERRHLVDLLGKIAAYWQEASPSQQHPPGHQARRDRAETP